MAALSHALRHPLDVQFYGRENDENETDFEAGSSSPPHDVERLRAAYSGFVDKARSITNEHIELTYHTPAGREAGRFGIGGI